MNGWSGTAIVILVGLIILRGIMTGSEVYTSFLRGAEKGMRSALSLLPALCGMLLMLAGTAISLIPMMVIYLTFNRYFVTGMTNGAVKG